MKTTYYKIGTRRRRISFADGSHLIVSSSSGYEIFEGIPKSKKAKLKPRATSKSPSSS